MFYTFNPELILAIQQAFLSAALKSDMVEHSAIDQRDYFFLAFQMQPTLLFDDDPETGSVHKILSGDKQLTDACNAFINNAAHIEMGFRWTGSCNDAKVIRFLGFSIKIIYSDAKTQLCTAVINGLCDVMKNAGLIASRHDLSQQFFNASSMQQTRKDLHTATFFFKRLKRPQEISLSVIELAKDTIRRNILPIAPAYVRLNEMGINPAYQDGSIVRTILHANQKKIWLFRSDFILAIGNKNAYWISFAEAGLPEVLSPRLHRNVNWEDRYGHPSLAPEYPGFNGSAFYGGLLAQRNGYLEIYISSGRYYRNDLAFSDKELMEAYLAAEFQKMYGEQTVVFIDAPNNRDYFECAIFYHDDPLPDYCPRREYDASKIANIFQAMLGKNICERTASL